MTRSALLTPRLPYRDYYSLMRYATCLAYAVRECRSSSYRRLLLLSRLHACIGTLRRAYKHHPWLRLVAKRHWHRFMSAAIRTCNDYRTVSACMANALYARAGMNFMQPASTSRELDHAYRSSVTYTRSLGYLFGDA